MTFPLVKLGQVFGGMEDNTGQLWGMVMGAKIEGGGRPPVDFSSA
jgi:hypothetical protein